MTANVPKATAIVVLVTGNPAEEGLAWSSDGSEVLFSAGADYDRFEVQAVTLGGRRRSVVQSAGGLTILDVASDGRWIVSRDDIWREMQTLGPGQTRERNLTWLELSYPIALTPDGRTILFTEESARAGPNYSTCIRSSDGSPVVRLGDGSAEDLSRDGRFALAVVPTEPFQQLFLYPTGAGKAVPLDRGGLVAYDTVTFFDDGKRIVPCGHEAGHGVRCYLQDLAGGKPVPLTPEGTTGGRPSPDGRRVAVFEPGTGLRIYPVPSGPGQSVPGAKRGDQVVRWTPDGKALLLENALSDVPSTIERLDVATGKREPYVTLGPADLTGALQVDPIALSDDGKSYVYGLRRMASHLFVLTGAK